MAVEDEGAQDVCEGMKVWTCKSAEAVERSGLGLTYRTLVTASSREQER